MTVSEAEWMAADMHRQDHVRARVAADRRTEILDAVFTLLIEHGYDRLTFDEIAVHARVGKATLYRHWSDKQALVVDAVLHSRDAIVAAAADTGTLVGDLATFYGDEDGATMNKAASLLASLMTALHHDHELASLLRREYLQGTLDLHRGIFDRAQQRGELAPGADPEFLSHAVPGALLHRSLVAGGRLRESDLLRAIDCIVLPWINQATDAGNTHELEMPRTGTSPTETGTSLE